MKVTVIPMVIVAPGTITKEMVNMGGGLGNKRMSGDHPNYSIVTIGPNIEKSPSDLRRLAVTQIPVENHQLTLV